jgi:hypothetical protein
MMILYFSWESFNSPANSMVLRAGLDGNYHSPLNQLSFIGGLR